MSNQGSTLQIQSLEIKKKAYARPPKKFVKQIVLDARRIPTI